MIGGGGEWPISASIIKKNKLRLKPIETRNTNPS